MLNYQKQNCNDKKITTMAFLVDHLPSYFSQYITGEIILRHKSNLSSLNFQVFVIYKEPEFD